MLLSAVGSSAADKPAILIDQPSDKAFRIALQRFASDPSAERAAGEIHQSLVAGLDFSGLFQRVPEAAFLGPVQSPSLDAAPGFNCARWSQIGSDALLQGEVHVEAQEVRVKFRVLDVARGCRFLVGKRYRGKPDDLRRMGKAMADDIVGAFTGQRGVADTEIAFVSDRSGSREIFVMDADGENLRAATHNHSINAFPDWAPDGEAIVYTSYRYRNRPWLFLLTRGTRSPGRILRRLDGKGPIYRGVLDPSGHRIALVRSVSGQAEIFTARRDGSHSKRLTRNWSIDVSPTWSPDGRRIAFVSDRTGSPQVYVMHADGSAVRRLTFDGSYNTGPAWSPDGRWIAYETRVNAQFDLWLVDPEGRTNVPLVTHRRSDEQPSWAPDSRMLAFSSSRRGSKDIYVIGLGDRKVRRLTHEGDNTAPTWGPYRR